ncbi:MAG: hypothetical protein P8Q14_03495 [Vicingaceae bacterium]|nr:hypothetical protein [Vicingaceae bacterium]
MSLIKDIQEGLGRFKLKREQKHLQRKAKAFSLEGATTVGVLYNATNRAEAETVKNFIQYLKEERKEVVSLGYIASKEVSEQINPILSYTFFDQNDLSKNMVPKGSDVTNFINKPFSILIDLNIKNDCFPLEYISSLSLAKFKVGANGTYRDNDCDLTIDISENKKVEYLIIQIKYYLKMIKN